MKFFLYSVVFSLLIFFSGHAQALTSGSTATGNITAGGTSPQSFSGTAGQGFVLNAQSSTYGVKIQILNPDGSVWMNKIGRASGTLPSTGTYSVILSADSTTATGAYTVYYVMGSEGVSNGSLTSAQTYNGSLTANQINSFQITGTAGKGIVLNSAAEYSNYIFIYKPDGSYWTGSSDGRVDNSFPVSGTYTVVFEGFTSVQSGAYRLYLQIGGEAVTNGSLTSAQTYNGSLSANQINSFQMTGTVGKGIFLNSAAEYSNYISIYKPDGSYWTGVSNGRIDNTFPVSGTYTVVFKGFTPSQAGSYKLYLQIGGEAVTSGSLTSTQTYNGSLAVNQINSFQITGTAGKSVFINSAAEYPNYTFLYKPDGTYWTSANSNGRVDNVFPVSGTYTVVFEAFTAVQNGAYKLYPQIVGESVSKGALKSGQTYNGTLASNQINSFEITGTAGQGFLLNAAASYSNFTYIYKPDGTYWKSANSNGRLDDTFPSSGTYTVIFQGFNPAAIGPYKLYYVKGADNVSDGLLVSGITHTANLYPNGLGSYKFSGTTGNSLSITSTGSFSKYVIVYLPNGNFFKSGTDSVSGTLTATGDYTVVVEGVTPSMQGGYSITLTTPQPVPVASTPSKVDDFSCTEGNPINFDVGFKVQEAIDYNAEGLSFSRIYRSDSTWTDNTVGYFWKHNYARTLTVTSTAAAITDGSGSTTNYTLTGGVWVPNDPSITATFKTVGSTYVYTLPDNTVEKYDSSKRLTRIEYLGGGALNLAYNASGQLTTVTNENGRQLTLTYLSGRVSTLVTPDGTFGYAYDTNGNLKTVTKPDTKTIQYHYENATLIHALTGITDENNVRFATFTYDSATGKGIRTEHAGGVDDYDFAYNANGTSTTTNPLNKNTIYNFVNILGVRKIVQVDGQASTNCVASNRFYNYNEKGWMIGKTDWENNQTTYQYDARGNITQLVTAANSPEQQVTNSTYDPTFNLPDVVTETGKTTDYNYDAYGRMTSVTVTDTATAEARTTTYTYWANSTDPSGNVVLGRLKQIDGPRTDVTDTTNFAYDANFNLTTITNALSQVTQIMTRDAAGRPTKIRDINNIDTVLTYDSNGWLKTSTRASGNALAALTTYDYDFNGNLTKVTLPNGVFVSYSYDNAKRLTGVKDVANNTITYTLDNAGNITKEDIKDSSAVLKYTHSQVFDELSRIIHSVGAATVPQTDTSAYDKNSNLKTYTDPKNNATGYAYDGLQRLVTTTDALTGVVTQGYDTLDNLTSVKDQRNHTTTYTYNAFGDVMSETSPDRGLTSYVLDKAGNVTQKTDARSIITNYTYDALNRLKTVAYPSQTALNATLTYDTATGCGTAPKGQLCSVTDGAGSIAYQYDVLGRMTQEADTRGTVVLTTQYGYDLAGTLTSLTLPSTRTVGYTLNTNGRVNGVTAKVTGVTTTLASAGTYLPFGPMTGLTYGNSKVLTAAFDADYNPTSRAVAGLYSNTYGVDANSNITQAGTTTYGYDALNRVNAENPGAAASYSYDLTDNRLTKVVGSATTSTTVSAANNKISAVGSASYAYDLAGNITGDGTNTYTWNAAGQLDTVKVGTTTVGTYSYDYLGRRAKKVAGATTTYYAYGPNGLLYGEYSSTGTLVKEYVYLSDAPLAQIATGSPEVLTYLHTDHLGTPRYATNTAGTSVWSWTNDAFGISVPTGTVTVNLRMPGQFYDAESGNFYNWNRYYNPNIGRYISSDPIGQVGGLNLFSYGGQNPVMNLDVYGLCPVGSPDCVEPFISDEAFVNTTVAVASLYPLTAPFARALNLYRAKQAICEPATASSPKPAKNFVEPTNAPQSPPLNIPAGWRLRIMPATKQYPNGYWRLEKPMTNGGWQGINPNTMKPGTQAETHIPLP